MKLISIVVLCACILCIVSICNAQSLRYGLSFPYTSLSAYSSQQNDVFSFSGNQAALGSLKQSAVGVFGERRFMLQENSLYNLAAAVKTQKGSFGLQINYGGFSDFNENKLGLAYGRSLGERVDLGIQFNYYSYRIPGYPGGSAVNAEAGVMVHLTNKVSAGVHAYNPAGTTLNKTGNEKLASAYKMGVGYDVSKTFFTSIEFIKEENKPVNVIGGLQYQFAGQFFARGGFTSETGGGYAGAGLKFQRIRLDIAGNYHPQLGLSPGLLLIYNFSEK